MNLRKLLFLLVLIGCPLLLRPPGAVPETGVSEYQVKAAFLYQFPKFVEWPAEGGSASSTFTICVLGNAPLKPAFASLSGQTVKGRRVVISYLVRIEEMKECDILYVSASEKAKLGQILAAVASRPILTVSDIKRFIAAGGMIGFVSVNDKVRFEINTRVAHRSGLRISSQLLKLAASVTD